MPDLFYAFLLQIAVLAPAFKAEDREINARPHDFDHDGGEDPDFSGFHKIEHLLYRDGTLSGAQSLAAKLQVSPSGKAPSGAAPLRIKSSGILQLVHLSWVV